MKLSKITKALLATSSFIFSYKTSCQAQIKNQSISKFVQTTQYPANNPIEDRVSISDIKKINGLLVSVFDGHGGDICAEYVSKNINKFFDEAFQRNLSKNNELRQVIKTALSQCYDDLENGFFSIFKENVNDITYQTVGACALTAVITPNFVVVGNAGDCEGVFLRGKKIVKANERLNAGEENEQKRLKQQFPNEKDIFKCIMMTNYCYVKGRLQPTRSFGDYYLKKKQYNFTNISTFTGPYITHKPKLNVFNLDGQIGKTLVLATDGLWDELSEDEMQRQLQNYNGPFVADKLMQAAINRILVRNNISSLDRLNKIENRRKLHDDISIVTVDLQKFMEEHKNNTL